jgi:hypothetical protein
MPDGMEGLSQFILVLHDIATLNLDAGAQFAPPVLVTLVRWQPVPPFRIQVSGDKNSVYQLLLNSLNLKENEEDFKAALRGMFPRQYESDAAFLSDLLGALKTLVGKKLVEARTLESLRRPDYAAAILGAAAWNRVGFREERQIKPQYLATIKQRMKQLAGNETDVAITWEEWMEITTPYHGTRTVAKAEGSAGQLVLPRAPHHESFRLLLRNVTPGLQAPLPPNVMPLR